MAPEVAEILETARSLRREQIADLTYELLRVLDEQAPETDRAEVDEAWHAEVRHRIEDVESGKTQLVSHEETVSQARAMLAARRK